ncbi:J domain-containing protein [Natronosalvus rutilus]|uniref:DnaJ domain-containing protein n=1 Tax=Natronosalvus rutilus TaxID=2953753 RepID=A0A9E7N8D3_9EURY|nr:DnaJ domain-containing protein [Natronosalvus rutilus]UTF52399.1 DnaJ domain-containing protein [Natronosalvus rutilus]
MTDDIDFYDLLDISSDASQDDVKQAFREQVRVYHPDLNDDARAQAQFTALKKAYDILGDPVERQAYDRLGHEDYVAKRTSGLPSPDLWKSARDADKDTDADADADESEDDSSRSKSDSDSDSKSGSRSRSSTTRTSNATSSATSAGGTTGSRTSSESASAGAGSASASTSSTSTGTETGASTGTNTRSKATASSASAGGTTTGTADSTGSRTGSSPRSHSHTGSHSRPGRLTNNALVRWWRNQNFAWPLIWTSILVYLVGLVHFGLEHENALSTLAMELQSIGAEPNALWTSLSTSRHDISTPFAFVSSVELIAPPSPLEPIQWYGVLAGVVGLSLLLVLAARIAWRDETWGPVSIDETIVVGVALTAATMAVGGPLLVGSVLMPLLIGVVVHRTHQLPGWSPSYLYVLGVLAPLVGFAVAAAGYATLPADLALFVVVPLLGALGLPLRVSVRKRFGR